MATLTDTLRIGKLDSMQGLRLEMAKIYRAGRRGLIDTQDMTRFIFALKNIASVLAESDLELRLTRMELALRVQADIGNPHALPNHYPFPANGDSQT